jgi:hypothetical protein
MTDFKQNGTPMGPFGTWLGHGLDPLFLVMKLATVCSQGSWAESMRKMFLFLGISNRRVWRGLAQGHGIWKNEPRLTEKKCAGDLSFVPAAPITWVGEEAPLRAARFLTSKE